MTNHWLLKPELFDDELFSSWLIRAALLHGCDPITLTNSIWPKWRIWTIDRDRSIPKGKLKTLIKLVDVDSDFFENAFIEPIVKKITNTDLHTSAIWPFLLAYGMRNRRSHAGLQFCPICINNGEPYFRRSWRIAWNVICPIHKTKLIDHCSHCLKPIQIQKIEFSQNSLIICPFCEKYIDGLCQSKHENYSNAFDLQTKCNDTLNNRSANFRKSFFRKLQLCISIVRFSQRTPSIALSNFMKELNITVSNNSISKTGLVFELLAIDERYRLLELSHPLMISSYSKIIQSLKNNNVSFRLIQSMKISLPKEFETLARIELKGIQKKQYNSISISKKKPKSIRAVKQMHARLLRKFNSYS